MRRSLISIVEIVCPEKKKSDIDQLIIQIESLNRSITGISGIGLSLSFFLVEFLPLIYKFRRFSSLSKKDRIVLLNQFEDSGIFPLRLAVMLIKAQIMLVHYSQEASEKAIGYSRER